MRELKALTGARGVAAWFVVLFHIRASLGDLPPLADRAFAKGYLAVDFFFLLSGFVIWLAWHDRLGNAESVVAFWRRRVARVWPLHALMLSATVAFVVAIEASGRHPKGYPFAELPLHVALVQNWGFTDALAWNIPAWSISCEAAAYLLFPVLALAVDWRRLPGWALAVLGLALAVALHVSMRDVATLGQAIPRQGLTRALIEFAGGTLVCAAWLRLAGWRTLTLACAATIALGIAWGLGAPETLVVAPMLAALLLALALSCGRRGNPLEARIVHYLGEVSYATYLSHYLLWRVFKLVFVRQEGAVPATDIAAYLLATLALSALLYHFFERPAQRWLNGARWRRPARAEDPEPRTPPRGTKRGRRHFRSSLPEGANSWRE